MMPVAAPSNPAPAPSATPRPEPSGVPVLASDELSIPDIGVQSVLNPLGVDADGGLEVPARGPHYDEAAWFTGSPRPGETGPAVLMGHVNGRGGTPSVFFRLAELGGGDPVTVSRTDGTTATFEVYRTEQYPKDEFPTTAVYGDTAGSELRLITCAGSWDAAVGHYRDNVVVYAQLVSLG
jgi:sortase (surface protein transpeptidase)